MFLRKGLEAGDEGDHEIVPVPVHTLAGVFPEDEIHHAFRCGHAAIAFAFSGRCSWKFAGLLPLVCRLVDIGMCEPIPISCLAGEVMAAGIGVGSGGRIEALSYLRDEWPLRVLFSVLAEGVAELAAAEAQRLPPEFLTRIKAIEEEMLELSRLCQSPPLARRNKRKVDDLPLF
jgi:hypothetical protein